MNQESATQVALPWNVRLRTFVSPVMRPTLSPEAQIRPGIPLLDEQEKAVCWLDELFGGGIVLPRGVLRCKEPPLLWLMTGPPGSGKTTLALEICHNLATKPQDWPENLNIDRRILQEMATASERRLDFQCIRRRLIEIGIHPNTLTTEAEFFETLYEHGLASREGGYKIRSLYIALETPADRIIENMERFGWNVTAVKQLNPELRDIPAGQSALMWVLGTEYLKEISKRSTHEFLRRLGDRWEKTWGENTYPGVVVIDSLNTLPRDFDIHEAIDAIRDGLDTRTWLMIVIREGGAVEHEPLEFLADIITRLDEVTQKDYLLRTFSIVKAKNQEHAWGSHRSKIYSDPQQMERGLARGRVAPYLERGGLYVFPSVHRLLSASWRVPEVALQPEDRRYPLPLPDMDVLLGMEQRRDGQETERRPGLPRGGCTAFIGPRGLMKSHLAYHWLLRNLGDNKEMKGLLLSLRDDETRMKETLRRISERENLGINVDNLVTDGRLTIYYVWPGYIPPEEFMHNVLVRIYPDVQICVVNGVDHIPARLPLCAALDAFVPTLVTLLSRRGITSVFAATEEQPGALATMGLLPMADLILRFAEASPEEEERLRQPQERVEQIARVAAERVPAGGIGGRSGYLFRVSVTGEIRFALAED